MTVTDGALPFVDTRQFIEGPQGLSEGCGTTHPGQASAGLTWVVCITATQSRPNNSQLQTRLVCRQGWRRSTLGSWQFISPTRFQNAQTGRRPGYARPPLPTESASRVDNWATFSFDEPHPLSADEQRYALPGLQEGACIGRMPWHFSRSGVRIHPPPSNLTYSSRRHNRYV
jgi:hypothetical protein